MLADMRRRFLWVQLAAAALVVLGVWLQVYLIAAFFFGAEDALDLHETVGFVTHLIELLVFLAALGAWWRNWGRIGHAFGLIVIGTVQISFTGSEDWVGGLHGLFALVILVMAVFIVKDDLTELRRARVGPAGTDTPPPPA